MKDTVNTVIAYIKKHYFISMIIICAIAATLIQIGHIFPLIAGPLMVLYLPIIASGVLCFIESVKQAKGFLNTIGAFIGILFVGWFGCFAGNYFAEYARAELYPETMLYGYGDEVPSLPNLKKLDRQALIDTCTKLHQQSVKLAFDKSRLEDKVEDLEEALKEKSKRIQQDKDSEETEFRSRWDE